MPNLNLLLQPEKRQTIYDVLKLIRICGHTHNSAMLTQGQGHN